MVPMAVPETSALAVTSVAGGGMERERVTPNVGADKAAVTKDVAALQLLTPLQALTTAPMLLRLPVSV